MLASSLLILPLLAAVPVRSFSEERMLLDRRLAGLAQVLPDGVQVQADSALVQEFARGAGLQGLEVQPAMPVENGARGELPIRVQAQGRFADVDRFVRLVAMSPRMVDVERLSLTASTSEVVALDAILRFPFRTKRATLPPPPEDAKAIVSGVPRPTADQFLRDQALALAKADAIVQVRRSRRNPRLFLSEMAAVVRERAVTLAYAEAADGFVVRGLAVGEATVRGLEQRLESGFFRLDGFLLARRGGCYTFEARGTSPVVGPEADLPLPSEDPFRQDRQPCALERDSSRGFSIRVPPPKPVKGKLPPGGPYTVRARDVDLADLFAILAEATGENFVVDGALAGRVGFEMTRVTLEEILAQLQQQKVAVSHGPVRQVGRGAATPAGSGSGDEGSPPMRLSVKRANVREILALLATVDPALASHAANSSLGQVSFWSGGEVPAAAVRRAVLQAAGLAERVVDDVRIVEGGPAASASGEVVPIGAPAADRRLVIEASEMSAEELEIVAIAQGPAGWVAFAYTPVGALQALRVGSLLADGTVRGISAGDVEIETERGPVRLVLGVP